MRSFVRQFCFWSLLLWTGSVVGQQIPNRPATVRQPATPVATEVLSRTAISASGTSTGAVSWSITPPAGTSASDTVPVFTAEEFYQAVLQHHPIVRQAGLLSQEAQAQVQQARGAFDPRLFSDYKRKNFGNTLYYDKWQSGLVVPVLPGGLDVKMGYDRNMGKYLNPEYTVPPTGLIAFGVSVPVSQGLLIDARRNTLRQAQLGINLADADRLSLINKTILDAAKAYWDWYLGYQQFRWIERGYQLAQTRFIAIRRQTLIGDTAPIDTTEALITVQDRQVQLQQAVVDLQNTRLGLTAFLWSAKDNATPQPVDLPLAVIPQAAPPNQIDQVQLQELLNRAAQQHPDLIKLASKQQQLTIEERYRRALLLPKVSVEASLLSRGPLSEANYDGSNAYGFQADNHKIGVDLAFPLFLRAERGKLRQVQLQNQQTGLERQQTGRDIVNQVQQAWNELAALERQIVTQQQTMANQDRLVRAEVEKFQLGESSLFLVNSREAKLIDYQIKLEELRSKQQKALANLWYAAGTSIGTR
ncbi:TolC family protein [Spirosoma agri]|uniref:TolC family protein n=1 Tax=Spirosoma agri TaxID=1987381 RepID=A0A6M0IIE5_9BACT|nr:TolC family protein [Spirosoma agri]NEU68040.1 TolC family protein [Spirosoma agri]